MSDRNDLVPVDRSIESGRLHPLVYKILLGLAGLYVVAAWSFAGGGQTDLVLAIVSYVVLVGVGLPALLSVVRRMRARDPVKGRFSEWAEREIELQSGPVKGKDAAIEIALPIAAVAVGLVAFATTLHFAVG
jgi:hypothetical protein